MSNPRARYSSTRSGDTNRGLGPAVNLPVVPHLEDQTNPKIFKWGRAFSDVSSIWFNQIIDSFARTYRIVAGKMEWKGEWANGFTYLRNDVVRDGAWTMIALRPTTDKPAPVASGPLEVTMPDVTLPSDWNELANNSNVFSGQRYVFTESGWFSGLRVWVPTLSTTTSYRIVVIQNPTSATPITAIINDPVLTAGEWTTVSRNNTIVTAGTELLVYVDALDSGGTSDFGPEQWVTAADSNNTPPATGEWNKRNDNSTIRINKIDANSNNWSLTLDFVPQTVISIVSTAIPTDYLAYRTTGAAIDGGTYWEYPVTFLESGGSGVTQGNPVDISAAEPIPSPTEYVEIPDFWLTGQPSWATVQGVLSFDDAPQANVENNAYGVDIAFTPGSISADWDLVATSSTVAGGGSSGFSRVVTETAINASSFIDQLPVGLGTPLQLTFGPPQTAELFTLDANGVFTCLLTDEYLFFTKLVIGRRGSSGGVVQIYARILINGVPSGNSSHTIIDNPDIEVPVTFSFNLALRAGDTITMEIVRDTDGTDAGGLYAGNPDVVGWNASPSCTLDFSRQLLAS